MMMLCYDLEDLSLDTYHNIEQSEKGAKVSIAAYVILSLLKVTAGYWTGSKALMADGLNNTTDIVASVAVLIGLKMARKPPDSDHPYGHFRTETVSALIASFIMASVAVQVLLQAAHSLIFFKAEAPDPVAAWIALVAAICMLFVYMYNKRLAVLYKSQALMAAAKDNLSDAMVSIGVVVGVIGSRLGLPWLDPLAALVVGVMIAKTAWDIFKSASHNLTDGFDENKLETFRKTAAATPGVLGVKDIKARILGSIVLVDIIITVDPRLNVTESHNITNEIERRMLNIHSILNAHVHVEPLTEVEKIVLK